MELNEIKRKLERHQARLYKKYSIRSLGIFGSVSRGTSHPNSDIDILVEFSKPVGIEFIDLADELENLLQIKVDLISKNAIKPKYYKLIEPDLSYVGEE